MQIDDGKDFLNIYNSSSENGEMMAQLTGKMNQTISILGNQMFVVLHINEASIGPRRFNIKILESMYDFSICI